MVNFLLVLSEPRRNTALSSLGVASTLGINVLQAEREEAPVEVRSPQPRDLSCRGTNRLNQFTFAEPRVKEMTRTCT